MFWRCVYRLLGYPVPSQYTRTVTHQCPVCLHVARVHRANIWRDAVKHMGQA